MKSMTNRKERWGKAKKSWYLRAWQQKKKQIEYNCKVGVQYG